jgi:methylglutaconyl-CoA hydratase
MSEVFVQSSAMEPGIVSIMLDRSHRRNALCVELMEQLIAAVEALASDPAARVLILHGAGPVFSAGLDLEEATRPDLVERSAQCVQKMLLVLRESPVVSIAAVQGGAFAGGAGLMAACDIVLAADDARFGFPEAQRGLLPALIADVLKRKIRCGDLRELFLAGRSITAARAQQIGLVQRVIPPRSLLEEALATARAVLTGGPETIRQTKWLLNEIEDSMFPASGPDLIHSHLSARHSDEAREGLQAFLEKRNPVWIQT